MKPIFKRFIAFLAPHPPATVSPDEIPSEEKCLSQRIIVTTGIASFLILVLEYSTIRTMVARIGVWWAEGLVYAVIPAAITFLILQRSCWHREVSPARRTCSLVATSSAIVGSVIMLMGGTVALVWFLAVALRTCAGGR